MSRKGFSFLGLTIICLVTNSYIVDSTKNRLAMNVISRLIASCCWSNIHVVPQHGAVFEIRVADGYGARWSKDGTKVYIYAIVVFLVTLCLHA